MYDFFVPSFPLFPPLERSIESLIESLIEPLRALSPLAHAFHTFANQPISPRPALSPPTTPLATSTSTFGHPRSPVNQIE